MSIDAARAFNHLCKPGTQVEAVMRDGSKHIGTLKAPAFLWSGMALVEVRGLSGYYTVQAVRPLRTVT